MTPVPAPCHSTAYWFHPDKVWGWRLGWVNNTGGKILHNPVQVAEALAQHWSGVSLDGHQTVQECVHYLRSLGNFEAMAKALFRPLSEDINGADPGQDPTPRGGGGCPSPPLQTPKWLYRTMGFVGAGDFVLGIQQGEIFLVDPMCLYSKYSEFCGEFKKWMKSTNKDFDPDLISGSDLG